MVKKFTTLAVVFSCTLFLFLSPLTSFSSAVTGETATVVTLPKDAEKGMTPESALNVLKDMSYADLAKTATFLKGSKLSLKEKIGLKLFGKKYISKLQLDAVSKTNGEGEKSQITAALLCGLLGSLGIHRFYLGYTWQGIVQLLTLGGCGIWSLIDFIRILTGSLQPKDSEYAKTF